MKILIISASGIGNTILFTPALRILRESRQDAEIVFLGLNKDIKGVLDGGNMINNGISQVVEGSTLVNRVIKDEKYRKFKGILSLIRDLRKEKFDFSITAFPSNKWQFNLFARVVGAKSRVVHKYKSQRLSFLQNKKVPVDEKIHDVEQNMNLLKPLDVPFSNQARTLYFHVKDEDRQWANSFVQENDLDDRYLVGFHPGSSKEYGFLLKRWPAEYFAKLAKLLIHNKGACVLVFLGPDEKDIAESFKSLEGLGKLKIIEESLSQSAALMEKCNLFVSNDSGLMHIAAAVGVKTVGLFGPTNWQRTSPYGQNTKIVRLKNMVCAPCLNYPFKSSKADLECKEINCLKKLTPEQVYQEIFK